LKTFDYAVIGSGIVGVSVAYHLMLQNPSAKVVILEKETNPFRHQTSHNSGVIHAGIYYKPGSLKSKFCIDGMHKTYEFCKKNNIEYNQCGKIISASSNSELDWLHNLYENADKETLSLKLLTKKQIRSIEPNLNSYEGIFSPKTGIINWSIFANSLLEKFITLGGEVIFNYLVTDIKEKNSKVFINHKLNSFLTCNELISCGGLQSDRIANMLGIDPEIKIVPFRGDYYLLKKKFNNLFKHLIYPTPNPKMPFLGIHFTKMIDGSMTLGPNASVNFSREDYKRYSLNFHDIQDYLSYRGFWKLVFSNKEFIAKELLTSISKSFYLRQCQRYYKDISINDLLPFKAGIRAQAVTKEGILIHDFLLKKVSKCLFILNAPSPAATSSIPIGKYIVDKYYSD